MAETDEHQSIEDEFTDYIEDALTPARRKEVDAHLAECARCREELESFRETMGTLSGLKRMPAPARMDDKVASTIHERSAGRFFGRRAFGDRVPFELLAVLGLVIILAVVFLVRWSVSGSLHDPLERAPVENKPEGKRVLPTPE